MGMKSVRVMTTWILSLVMVLSLVGGAHAFSNVLAFGDSLSDNGASDGYGAAVSTNGQVWVEYLADDLGASLFDMAYSGATTGMDNPAVSNYYLDLYNTTLNPTYLGYSNFFATSTGLQWQAGAYAANFGTIANDTLITISAGGNDMFNGRSAIDAANNIAGVLSYLISIGGDAFMVMNLSPSQQPEAYQLWMAEFNAALAANLAALQSVYTTTDFYLLDMTTFVAEADNYTGTWKANSCESPTADPATCTNETFAWYDYVGVHPTTEVHKQIADLAMATIPEPAALVLLITGFVGLVGIRRKK